MSPFEATNIYLKDWPTTSYSEDVSISATNGEIHPYFLLENRAKQPINSQDNGHHFFGRFGTIARKWQRKQKERKMI